MPIEDAGKSVAGNGGERIAEATAEAMRAVGVSQPLGRDAAVQDRKIGWVKHAVAKTHERNNRKEPSHARREAGKQGAAGEQSHAAEQHRARTDAIDHETRA